MFFFPHKLFDKEMINGNLFLLLLLLLSQKCQGSHKGPPRLKSLSRPNQESEKGESGTERTLKENFLILLFVTSRNVTFVWVMGN